MTRLLIVGPQGSGKGTQGAVVAGAYGVPVVSTGDIFRENIRNDTELGRRVKEITSAGDLVPDELTGEIVRDRLSQPDAQAGFLLDGYPRNGAQVADLDGFLSGRGESLDAVILLEVPREESISRLTLRAEKEGRDDDTTDAIAKRLDIYESETAPIVDIYSERGVLDRIDGVGTLDEITGRIVEALSARGLTRV
ncbi:MAG: adenylate kinase [Microbacterium sp.]